jgi:hypothetical protein
LQHNKSFNKKLVFIGTAVGSPLLRNGGVDFQPEESLKIIEAFGYILMRSVD